MAWRARDKQQMPQGEYRKPDWSRLYNDHHWKRASKAYREVNALCVECGKHGVTKAATCVDHIVPHRGNAELFWDRDNWQALCDECHARKSAGERG